MGIFDKAKDALGEHSDKVDEGIDKAGDFADEKTGGEHADKIDKGQEFAKDRLSGLGGDDQNS
ncbi:antitoxin [Kribbella sp. NBC_01505]|uniref:antitoxin n=1 Tax=Kribbella sp. NBC_01505 TaxID=2903580 RepID=UPI00386BD993